MLADHISSKNWKENFQSKFFNFCKKSPVLLSCIIKIQNGEEGVLVTHSNSGYKYFFPFNYNINVKDFIASIKQMLVERHYPILIEEIYDNVKLTAEELAIKVEKGMKLENLKNFEIRKIGERRFVLDKILLWKSVFILRLIESDFPEDKKNDCYRYKYQGNGSLFLKKYRNNAFGSLEAASSDFFSNSLIIDKLKEPA
jgi:hypothetical protein